MNGAFHLHLIGYADDRRIPLPEIQGGTREGIIHPDPHHRFTRDIDHLVLYGQMVFPDLPLTGCDST